MVVCSRCLAGTADVPLFPAAPLRRRQEDAEPPREPLDVALGLVAALLDGQPDVAVRLTATLGSTEALKLAGMVCRLLMEAREGGDARLHRLSVDEQLRALQP
jgi:hypothetical protein